jgi:hypothetical protein
MGNSDGALKFIDDHRPTETELKNWESKSELRISGPQIAGTLSSGSA